MKCSYCGNTQDGVIDSRRRKTRKGEDRIYRRRECLACHRRYRTYEYIEDVMPSVVKRSGRCQSFDSAKLRTSIQLACGKHASAAAVADEVAAFIETGLRESLDRRGTIESAALRIQVIERLAKVDPASCVRYAIGHGQPKNARELLQQLTDLAVAVPSLATRSKIRDVHSLRSRS